MARKTTETAPVKTPARKKPSTEKELSEISAVERELATSLERLNGNLHSLDTTLNLIREHEFVEFHKSKWKIFAYQVLLGILFAVGTVLGLIILSWLSYTYFKDSQILRDIVDSQLKMRKFDLQELKDKAVRETENSPLTPKSSSGVPKK